MDWIKITDRRPLDGQKVWYYFDVCGVNAGYYELATTASLPNGNTVPIPPSDVFYGEKGFLCDDVTHWLPREDGDIKPDPPV